MKKDETFRVIVTENLKMYGTIKGENIRKQYFLPSRKAKDTIIANNWEIFMKNKSSGHYETWYMFIGAQSHDLMIEKV